MIEKDRTMDNLTFKKPTVLSALKENRVKHLEVVKESNEGYKNKLSKLLKDMLKDVKNNKEVKPYINLDMPVNHMHEYDRAIRMLEMCTDETIVLTQREFECYVMDEWQWRKAFLTSNAMYSKVATEMSKVIY